MASVKDKKTYQLRTICEVHREIYDILLDKYESNNIRKEIEERLEESYQMAKKMDLKLKQYKNGYDDGWWEVQRKEILEEKLKYRNYLRDNKQ